MKRDTYYRKLDDALFRQNVKCKCGHSVFLPTYEPIKICSHCNNYVFKDGKTKFKFMLSKRVAVGRG